MNFNALLISAITFIGMSSAVYTPSPLAQKQECLPQGSKCLGEALQCCGKLRCMHYANRCVQ
ncbi:hypothetical protein CONCODRAFT_11592 [Conidiobolus coronatus NRRL 28638]|uniref:Uncharacterized protein n=1 Tax=Conidiobolus coronatus (strain ATCC 28846 / CBS 209.66 / NRRL 28638) TaxID=796925 RepID=A0A137NUV0_CONC2|nr:hypothetical protein CONCODRAFT_11592 [Conidiobolus coronatus NRRL 28638]|eukprot:KXN66526.1 hypothetical protein CONCODRAFT_11592 [Conidiobolus coronatus NRRL 28638]